MTAGDLQALELLMQDVYKRQAGCKAVVVPDITPIPPESEGLWAARAATLADVIPLLECL